MYGPTGGQLFVLAVVVSVFGWGVIESALWLFDHLSITWK